MTRADIEAAMTRLEHIAETRDGESYPHWIDNEQSIRLGLAEHEGEAWVAAMRDRLNAAAVTLSGG
jgi:hypothetical protein